MDGERVRAIGATWLLGAVAAATLALTAWALWPFVHHGIADSTAIIPVFVIVARDSVIAGVVGGGIGWLASTALTRTRRVKRGLVFTLALAAGVTVVNLSATGWVSFFATMAENQVKAQALHQYRAAVAEDRADLRRSLFDLNYPDFLYAPSLGAPGGLERARTKITTAAQMVAGQRDLLLQRQREMDNRVTSANIAAVTKANILKRLHHALDGETRLRLQLLAINGGIMAEYQAMLDDLAHARGRWKSADNKVYFESRSDLATYNKHVEAAKKLAAQATTVDQAIAHAADQADFDLIAKGR